MSGGDERRVQPDRAESPAGQTDALREQSPGGGPGKKVSSEGQQARGLARRLCGGLAAVLAGREAGPPRGTAQQTAARGDSTGVRGSQSRHQSTLAPSHSNLI